MNLPESLRRLDLPVAQQLHEIDPFGPNYVAVASTGGGKTLLCPPVEAMVRKEDSKGPVAMRVPTRAVGRFVTAGIRKFWGPEGLNVEVLDSDVPRDSPAERKAAKADLVVISDGSLRRLQSLTPVSSYFCDEAHYLSLSAEIDLALAKRSGCPIRILSATIDPTDFLGYLGPEAKLHELEGRVHPIEKTVEWASTDVFDMNEPDELHAIIRNHVFDLKERGESGITFLPTRDACMVATQKFSQYLPTAPIHGGVNALEAEQWVSEHEGQPFMVFATTAAAMGITINLHRALICDQLFGSQMVRGIERRGYREMDDDMCIQAAGRVGRLGPGKAVLITHRDHRTPNQNPWDDIEPRPVSAPSEQRTPYEVHLAMAQAGLSPSQVDLLGNLDPNESLHALSWLRQSGCLNREDDSITKLGNRVASFPLPTRQSHAVLSAPDNRTALLALAAFTIEDVGGLYACLNLKPRKRQLADAAADPSFRAFPPECVVEGSAPLTAANLLATFISKGPEARAWCRDNNLNPPPLYMARKAWNKAAGSIVPKSASRILTLTDFSSRQQRRVLHEHLKRHGGTYHQTWVEGTSNKTGGGPPEILDSAAALALGLQDVAGRDTDFERRRVWAMRSFNEVRNFKFWSLGMPILEPMPSEGDGVQ